MKKPLKITLIILGSLYFIYTILGLTGALKIYSNPTTSNEPNLKMNSRMLVSNIVDYNVGDFITYEYNDELYGRHIRVHRLCGIENDIIEIKKSIVYLNGEKLYENIDFIHDYVIAPKKMEELKNSIIIEENTAINYYLIDKNTYQISLPNSIAIEFNLQSSQMIDTKENKHIKELYHQNWTKDNFGPLIIPTGKIFVLGDNRDNSLDSRYIGLINISDIVGTVIKY